MLLEYPPGVAAPVHNHPVSATGYILEGVCESQWEGGELESYSAGESFIDHGERVHVKSENVGEGWLRMVLSYVIRESEANVNML